MTNDELNEKIAGLIGGWKKVEHNGWVHNEKHWFKSPPDFLAPDRIHELMDLAKKFTNDLDIHWVKTSGNEARCGFTGKWYSGDTPAEALARAIVAHKEGVASVPVDEFQDGHDCEHGAMPVDVFLNEKGHQECHRCGVRIHSATAEELRDGFLSEGGEKP